MLTFYHASLAGIEVEQAPKSHYVVDGAPDTDCPATFTDLRLAKRCFARISAAEIARLRDLRKRIAAARTREAMIAIAQTECIQ